MFGSQDFSCGGGVCCGNVVSSLTAAGLQRSWRLCWRQPLKELQRSVGDNDADWRLRWCQRQRRRRGFAMALVSAAVVVALAEAFTLVV